MLQQAPAKVKCLGHKDQVSVLYFRYFMRCSVWTLSVGFSLRSESCLAFVFDVYDPRSWCHSLDRKILHGSAMLRLKNRHTKGVCTCNLILLCSRVVVGNKAPSICPFGVSKGSS